MRKRFKTTLLLAALVLAGCAAPPTVPDNAGLVLPTTFKEAGATGATAAATASWWQAFGDPVLDELVARAERGNTGIQVAVARVAQARALLGSADA
ncbi:MAG: RND transporter, partial [Rubrivivax sp.]